LTKSGRCSDPVKYGEPRRRKIATKGKGEVRSLKVNSKLIFGAKNKHRSALVEKALRGGGEGEIHRYQPELGCLEDMGEALCARGKNLAWAGKQAHDR